MREQPFNPYSTMKVVDYFYHVKVVYYEYDRLEGLFVRNTTVSKEVKPDHVLILEGGAVHFPSGSGYTATALNVVDVFYKRSLRSRQWIKYEFKEEKKQTKRYRRKRIS